MRAPAKADVLGAVVSSHRMDILEDKFYKLLDSKVELTNDNVLQLIVTNAIHISNLDLADHYSGMKLRGCYDSYRKLQLLVILYNIAQDLNNLDVVLRPDIKNFRFTVSCVESRLLEELFKVHKRVTNSDKYRKVPTKLSISMVQRIDSTCK